MRICSLLPSITEVLFELGLGAHIVGVTHECDWPAEAMVKPKLHSVKRVRWVERVPPKPADGCDLGQVD